MYHRETWEQTRFIIHGSSCLYDPQLQLSAMVIIIFSSIPTRFYYMYNVVCISYFTLFRPQLFQPASITRPCDNTEAFHISFFSDSIPHSMHLIPWFVTKNQLHCLQRNRPFHNSLYTFPQSSLRSCDYGGGLGDAFTMNHVCRLINVPIFFFFI